MTDAFKRLYRSRSEIKLAGICGGLGVYFRVDPVIIRLLWIGVTLLTGVVPGLIAYVVAWLIVPQEPSRLPVRREEPVGEPHEGTA